MSKPNLGDEFGEDFHRIEEVQDDRMGFGSEAEFKEAFCRVLTRISEIANTPVEKRQVRTPRCDVCQETVIAERVIEQAKGDD